MNTKPKAIIHCRVSSSRQVREGESLDVQETRGRLLAEHRGWEVVKVFKEGYSASKAVNNAQGFNQILNYIDDHPGEISHYIFNKIDRFTREGTESYSRMKREIEKRGLNVIDTQGMIQSTVNTLDELGFEYYWSKQSPSEITEVVVATTSKQEITTIQTRMIGQEIRLTQNGYKVRGPQDGFINSKVYTEEGKKRTIMVPDPQRAKYIIAMFEMRAAGQFTDKQIVEQVNAMGYRTRVFNKWNKAHTQIIGSCGGNTLSVKHLQELIQRPIYAGFNCEKWTVNKPVKNKFDGLVSLETFNKANRGRVFIQQDGDSYKIFYDHYPEQIVLKRTRDNPMFPYKSVVVCEICDTPFLGSQSRSKSGKYVAYYHCSRKHKYVGYRKELVEDTLTSYLNSLEFKASVLPSLKAVLLDRFNERKTEIVHESQSVEESIEELELKKNRAVEAFKAATSDFMRQECEKEAIELDAQIKASQSLGAKIRIQESDIDVFMGYVKSFIEHPAELLLNTANTTQQVSLYTRVFEKLPSVPELDSRTPKLSYILRYLEDEDDSGVLAAHITYFTKYTIFTLAVKVSMEKLAVLGFIHSPVALFAGESR